ncbi:MARVEL-like domain protein [Niveomyces insectorum RCEF 264]|uniref:MARVEL-like domain protein n=1 Tax=Niveomyces insectorum RCEF 264 TaxID=1081102 RepID=A0A162MPV5_9HYPO|nr:MARVEL-like domain protein [Niveomyces insectorum RCEF 264]
MVSHDAARLAGREHIPLYPGYFARVRRLQVFVTLAVLGLDAYGLSKLSFTGDELMMFTCVASLIVGVYCLVAERAAPAAFNYWAVLGLDMLLVVFWLASFALLASQVAPFMGKETYCLYGECVTYGLEGAALVYADCLCAAAGLGGLNFLLYVVTLVVNGLALHRHRALGLHCTPGRHLGGDAEKNAAVASVATASSNPTPGASASLLPAAQQQQQQQQPSYYQQPAAAAASASGYAAVGVVPPQQAQPQPGYYPPQRVSPVPQQLATPQGVYYPPQQQVLYKQQQYQQHQ